MRLEIIVDDDQPLFYPFHGKLMIGSDAGCDIVIEHPEVSRKHVAVYPEGDQFFIADQGSRNGTYLNDERLVPGKKTEFTSFFPVRLGKSILVSLISDEEISESRIFDIPIPTAEKTPPPSRSQDQTSVISLKDLQSIKTSTLVKKRSVDQKTRARKEDPKKKAKQKKKSISPPQIVAGVILLGGLALHYYRQDEPVIDDNSSTQVKTTKKLNSPVKPVAPAPLVIPTAGDILISQLPTKGCETEQEKALCEMFSNLRYLKVVDKGVDILVDAGPYQNAANLLLDTYKEKSKKAVIFSPESKEIAQIMAAIYFLENMVRFPAQDFTNKVITLGFVMKIGEIETLHSVAAFNTNTLPSLNVVLTHQQLESVKVGGPEGLDFTNRFYTVWERDKIIWKPAQPSTPKTPIPETSTPVPTESETPQSPI